MGVENLEKFTKSAFNFAVGIFCSFSVHHPGDIKFSAYYHLISWAKKLACVQLN